jgi:ribonuclease E
VEAETLVEEGVVTVPVGGEAPDVSTSIEGERGRRSRGRRGRGRRGAGQGGEAESQEEGAQEIEQMQLIEPAAEIEPAATPAEVVLERTSPAATAQALAAEPEPSPAPQAAVPPQATVPVSAPPVRPAPAVQPPRPTGRAANDPRINPRPVAEVEIVTESLVIDPSSFPPVELPQPTRPQPPRAANDPRLARVAAVTTHGNAALDVTAEGEEAAEEIAP